MHTGPVLIVDDDIDDHELTRHIFEDLQLTNELIFFPNGPALLQYLTQTKEAPFVILCEVNLPVMDGFELRKQLLASPSEKFQSVPFIFWSTVASEQQIKRHTS